jgi:hypothetical protein
MQVQVLSIHPSHRPSCLAAATIRLTFEDGSFIEVDDLRILRNRAGQLWVGLPSYSVQQGTGRQFEFRPTLTLDRRTHRALEDALIPEYESWAAKKGGRQ